MFHAIFLIKIYCMRTISVSFLPKKMGISFYRANRVATWHFSSDLHERWQHLSQPRQVHAILQIISVFCLFGCYLVFSPAT